MSAYISFLGSTIRKGHHGWFWALLVGLSLSSAGCISMDQLRGKGFHDEYSDVVRQQRPSDSEVELRGFSNKARDIERDLGAGN